MSKNASSIQIKSSVVENILVVVLLPRCGVSGALLPALDGKLWIAMRAKIVAHLLCRYFIACTVNGPSYQINPSPEYFEQHLKSSNSPNLLHLLYLASRDRRIIIGLGRRRVTATRCEASSQEICFHR